MKRYIAIDLQMAKSIGISLVDWALLENIHFMSNNPSGWCYASKETLAEIVMVSRPTVYRMIDKLELNLFIKRDLKSGHLKATEKWVSLANGVSFNGLPAQSQNDTTIKNDSLKMRQGQYQNETNIVSKRDLKEDIKEENKGEARALDFLQINSPGEYETFLMQNKKQLKDFEKFCLDFNDTVDQEELKFTTKILMARLGKYARNWIVNHNKFNKPEENNVIPIYRKKITA